MGKIKIEPFRMDYLEDYKYRARKPLPMKSVVG